MASFKDRIIGAAMFKTEVYEEVEADKGATGQAIWVVIISSIAAGIGVGAIGRGGVSGVVVGIVTALAGWFIWAFLTYLIGAKMLPEPGTKADMGQMLRTIGFSSSPGLIRILGVIPGLGSVIFFVSSVWMFAAMVVAVRQALDYTSTLRAGGVCLLGWLIQVLLFGAVYFIAGQRAMIQ